MNLLLDNENVVRNYFSQLIYSSPEFRDLLKEKYPVELYADIESMISNGTNCSCKTRVEDFCYKNKEKLLPVLTDFIKSKSPQFDYFIEQTNNNFNFVMYSGKVINTTEEDWPDLYNKLNEDRAQFRSFSVVKDGENLKVFFL
jgi:hypothetical protein